jgi:citrate lyase beta subunit
MPKNSTPRAIGYLEQIAKDGHKTGNEVQAFDVPVRIHVHSIRNQLADCDGISAKAAIDGLVKAGLLRDDSVKWVKEVSYSQEKTEGEESTVITIEECGNDVLRQQRLWNGQRHYSV